MKTFIEPNQNDSPPDKVLLSVVKNLRFSSFFHTGRAGLVRHPVGPAQVDPAAPTQTKRAAGAPAVSIARSQPAHLRNIS